MSYPLTSTSSLNSTLLNFDDPLFSIKDVDFIIEDASTPVQYLKYLKYLNGGIRKKFTSLATNATLFKWDFGDGTTTETNERTIYHTYSSEGVYLVKHQACSYSWCCSKPCLRCVKICKPPGTGSPGYWKNHPDAWPVDVINIGYINYSKEVAIQIMQTPEKGDKTYTMFNALISAKLNVIIGNDDSCVADTISKADMWIATYPVGSNVRGHTEAWKIGEPLYNILDAYNNGMLCAPYRGEEEEKCETEEIKREEECEIEKEHLKTNIEKDIETKNLISNLTNILYSPNFSPKSDLDSNTVSYPLTSTPLSVPLSIPFSTPLMSIFDDPLFSIKDVDFIIEDASTSVQYLNGGIRKKFTSLVTNATLFRWKFGDTHQNRIIETTENPYYHTYKERGTYSVSHQSCIGYLCCSSWCIKSVDIEKYKEERNKGLLAMMGFGFLFMMIKKECKDYDTKEKCIKHECNWSEKDEKCSTIKTTQLLKSTTPP